MFRGVSPETHSGRRRPLTKYAIVEVVKGCPNIQEISINDTIGSIRVPVVSSQLLGISRAHTCLFFCRLIPNQPRTYEH